MLIDNFLPLLPWQGGLFFIVAIALACFELVFPYPKHYFHLVQAIGWTLTSLERQARRIGFLALSGAICIFIVLCGGCLLLAYAVSLANGIGLLVVFYLLWSGLALGALLREGKKAALAIELAELEEEKFFALNRIFFKDALEKESALLQKQLFLDEARKTVQMLVSRDVADMESPDLYRSLAESLSENFNDAFVAPFFWLNLAGPLGLWAFKILNTADSMWGYTDERFHALGKTAAKLDDCAAYIPARLSAMLLYLAAGAMKLRKNWPGIVIIAQQAALMKSPNAGWPMAAAAWLLHGRMGGKTPYAGSVIQKPLLGPFSGKWTADKIRQLIRLLYFAGVLTMLVLSGGGYLIYVFLKAV